MDRIKTEFYNKLNEYYQERDYLFTKKSFRGHAYSLIDFLLFFVTASILLLLGIVLSIINQDIFYFVLFFALSIIPYVISFLIIRDRKKQIWFWKIKWNIFYNFQQLQQSKRLPRRNSLYSCKI